MSHLRACKTFFAFTGILNDPDKRRRYDVGGFDSLDTTDREIHVDLSSLGVVSTAVAALFTKLGEKTSAFTYMQAMQP